ncbi:MAG: tRNA 2-thiouridine(34) synthase MnmA [Chloroflexi bacterium RBG_16_57_11]|nr:MAG: tRNA 2-thiouridine(34) synthase MnmA [Chloroflexi bacterium RBG_16_57_11]
MNTPPRVVVAMSGGVDSSVAAALLQEQGYEVIGMMMRLWSESGRQDDNRCCTPDAMAQARRVAALLNIPFYAVDAQQVFFETVVHSFKDGYAQGITPNPCLTCNRSIRWDFLLRRALALGADYMATGHYARLRRGRLRRDRLRMDRLHRDSTHPDGSAIQILRATDSGKDQSYVLHVLGQEQLNHALFPLGEYTKPQVRELARKFGLPVAERPESQDLCFLGQEDYRTFLQRNVPGIQQPGPILNSQGEMIGEHQGLAFFTIGQRKGLGLTSQRPTYVLAKDLKRNALVVGGADELGQSELVAWPAHWVSGQAPAEDENRAQVKIRYTAPLAWGWVRLLPEGRIRVRFDEPQRDITPGQAAVIYVGEVCLGGGIIQS